MPIDYRPYRPVGPILVRASTAPDDHALPPTAPTATPEQSFTWLAQQWSRPELRDAITLASRSLADEVDRLVRAGEATSPKAVHRAVLATASYLVRWQRRATPFGLFAGVTAATVGPATGRVDDEYTAVARADADWLARLVDRLEQHHELRRTLTVVADSSALIRDGRLIVAARPRPGDRTPGPVKEVSTRLTRAVHTAIAHATRPVRFDQLAAQMATDFRRVEPSKIDTMLHGLIDGGFLLTGLRPPMTAEDELAHVIAALHAANADWLPDVAVIVEQLSGIHEQLLRHNAASAPRDQATIRATAAAAMTALAPGDECPMAVDVRLNAQISIPAGVADEAAQVAGVLLRLTTQPFGSAAWLDYHTRFRHRYGPGALVPVRDLVADSGLGYPPGYLGAPRARPAWRVLTERDAYLLRLIQQAVLDGADEIALTDADIAAMTIGDPTAVVPPPRIELGVTIDARSLEALNRGAFTLRIVGAPRAYTSMAGRFAYLLDTASRERLIRTYAGTTDGDTVTVQLSFPPRRVHNQNVVRVGRLSTDVVAVSEHPDGDVISVDDLAVTADPDQLHLVQRSIGRRVIAYIPHALDTTVQTPPLARFIAEVGHARSAVFGPLDLGAAARTLSYTPRIRYRRTVLAPARWTLTEADLTPAPGSTGTQTNAPVSSGPDERWEKALHQWRQRWRAPARMIACHGELRLPLDLDRRLDRALLHHRLARVERLELREDGPADAHHWLGRPAELLIPMTLNTPTAHRLPVTAPPGQIMRPGVSPVVHAILVGNPGRFDELLTAHLPTLAEGLAELGVQRWWVCRHRDMIRLEADQHLSLVLRLRDPAAFGSACARLAAFAASLHERGMPADLSLVAYHQHPARYGHGPAMEAAEHVFASDTAAAISQLRMADHAGIPSQVVAAVSMAHLAAGFAPDPASGYQALLACLKGHTEPADRTLTDLTRSLADPTDEFRRLRGLPGGEAVTAAWHSRHQALRTYHARLLEQRDPAGVLRTLLHEHHVRAVGVDPEFERTTNHLARAVAMRCIAQAGTR